MATKAGWIKRKLLGHGIPWNKGAKLPKITGKNNSRYSRVEKRCQVCGKLFIVKRYRQNTANYCSQKCSHKGRLLPDNLIDYNSLHKWVVRHLGAPKRCSKCNFMSNNSRQFQWSNISHEYKRDLSDWQRLCVRCHHLYDRKGKTVGTVA
jgi:hypothetical protein